MKNNRERDAVTKTHHDGRCALRNAFEKWHVIHLVGRRMSGKSRTREGAGAGNCRLESKILIPLDWCRLFLVRQFESSATADLDQRLLANKGKDTPSIPVHVGHPASRERNGQRKHREQVRPRPD